MHSPLSTIAKQGVIDVVPFERSEPSEPSSGRRSGGRESVSWEMMRGRGRMLVLATLNAERTIAHNAEHNIHPHCSCVTSSREQEDRVEARACTVSWWTRWRGMEGMQGVPMRQRARPCARPAPGQRHTPHPLTFPSKSSTASHCDATRPRRDTDTDP